ncbi:MAG: ADP-ribosylglycohydrolase family protein, partial [Oscillospiraceae bacterium]|nr:ADP-ribosylglycohydrolase family protein [Oscillospiraceae bacterium]
TLEETLHAAELTARVTHNHPEGVKGAQAVAAAIYMARTGRTKDEIKAFVEQNFGYDLDTTLDEIRSHYHMDETCQGSVPQSFRAFLEGDSYESVVRLAVSIGGDSDTIACIAGSMAEAFYGLPAELKKEALDRLDPDLRGIALQFGVFLRLLQPLTPELAAAWEEEARREKNALALFTLGELYRDGLLPPAEGDAAKKAGELLEEAYYCLPADGSVEQAPDICMAFVRQRAAVTSRMVLNKATRLAAEGYKRRMLAGEPGAALQLAQVQQLRRKWNLT